MIGLNPFPKSVDSLTIFPLSSEYIASSEYFLSSCFVKFTNSGQFGNLGNIFLWDYYNFPESNLIYTHPLYQNLICPDLNLGYQFFSK